MKNWKRWLVLTVVAIMLLGSFFWVDMKMQVAWNSGATAGAHNSQFSPRVAWNSDLTALIEDWVMPNVAWNSGATALIHDWVTPNVAWNSDALAYEKVTGPGFSSFSVAWNS